MRHVDWDVVRCLVIAGPGFAKEQFKEFLDMGEVAALLQGSWLPRPPLKGRGVRC